MIKRLRIRFVVLSMSAFALVLLVVLSIINGLNYRQIYQYTDRSLELIWQNEGTFPVFMESKEDLPPRFDSPEAPYENRFFSVLLPSDEKEPYVNTDQIAAIDKDTALAYAYRAKEAGSLYGNMEGYRYIAKETADHDMLFVFLDFGRSMDNARSFMLISVILYACALLGVLILLVICSKHAVHPIAESYKKQKQFITDAGHELKTPLTIMDADSEVLLMDLGDNEWLQDIRLQCKNMRTLTQELINLSRMEEDRAEITLIDLPLSDLVTEGVQAFKAPAAVKGQTIACTVTPLISVCGNEKALRQLLSLLLDNAVKYANENSTINVSLTMAGQQAVLTVANPCEPIAKEDVRHLFDRFYRVDQARTSGKSGYGIGLSIAKAVVQSHKGKIWAETADGQSLTITVHLPISKVTMKEAAT